MRDLSATDYVRRVPALRCFLNFARFDAVGANGDSFDRTVDLRTHGLEVRKEPAWGAVMCMTHMVSSHRLFATDFTNSCHQIAP